MIVDAFIYNGEAMELQCRLYELQGLVHRHIAFCVEENDLDQVRKLRSSEYPLDAFLVTDVESTLRQFGDNDVFIYGEAKEVPAREAVSAEYEEPVVLVTPRLIYSMKYCTDEPVFGPVVGKRSQLKTKTFDKVLEARRSYMQLPDGGWTIEWFGGNLSILKGFENHPEKMMRVKAREVAEVYPREKLGPNRELLRRYLGPTPAWYADGHAPNSWDLTW